MKALIEEALYLAEEEIEELVDVNIENLESAGYLTNNKGLVVTLNNGKKYIVTVQEA